MVPPPQQPRMMFSGRIHRIAKLTDHKKIGTVRKSSFDRKGVPHG
jgi:hypothetical protein